MGVTIALASVGTLAIAFIVENTIGLRISEDKELEGMDKSLHGEMGYGLALSEIRM